MNKLINPHITDGQAAALAKVGFGKHDIMQFTFYDAQRVLGTHYKMSGRERREVKVGLNSCRGAMKELFLDNQKKNKKKAVVHA
jgi:hypothetical protein